MSTLPCNLSDKLLRDVASLLITSHLISRTLLNVRLQCELPREVTANLTTVIAISDAGESHLYQPLEEAGAILPALIDATDCAMVTEFFTALPTTMGSRVMTAEITDHLQLLSQHMELKVYLAVEEALQIGEVSLAQALLAWSTKWHSSVQLMRAPAVPTRPRTYVVDLDEVLLLQGA